MNNFNEKLGNICSSILLYGKNVDTISKPAINGNDCIFMVKDTYGIGELIILSIQDICKAHDYLLDNLIIETMREHKLL